MSDINDLLSRNIGEKLVGFDNDARKFYESLQAELIDFESNLKALETAAPVDTYDIMTLNRASQSRRILINKLNSLIREFRKTTKFDFHSMISFYNFCMLTLEQENMAKKKDSNLLDAYFPDQTKNLQSSYKSLSEMLTTFGDILRSKEELIKPIEEAIDAYNRLNSEYKQIAEQKKQILIVEERIQKLKSERDMLATELEKIINSELLKRFSESISRRGLINNKIKEMESNIILLLSSFDRPFRKFKKLVNLGEEYTDFKKELEMYINAPLDAVEFDKSQKILDSLLSSLKKCVNENKIETKHPEKILAKIDDIINDKSLAEMKKKLDLTLSERESLEKYIANETIQDLKLSLENNILSIQNDIKKLEREYEFLTKKLKELSDNLSVRYLSLKEMLEKIINREIELSI